MFKYTNPSGEVVDNKQQYQKTCPSCKGHGRIPYEGLCEICVGHGVVPTAKGEALLNFLDEFKGWK
jgi:DnaJ-class molecular chaperone